MARNIIRRIRNAGIAAVTSATVFGVAASDGCSALENAFMRGVEIGYKAETGEDFPGFDVALSEWSSEWQGGDCSWY